MRLAKSGESCVLNSDALNDLLEGQQHLTDNIGMS